MAVVIQRPELRRLCWRWDERRERHVPAAGGCWASGGGQASVLVEEAVTEAALAMAEAATTMPVATVAARDVIRHDGGLRAAARGAAPSDGSATSGWLTRSSPRVHFRNFTTFVWLTY